MSLFRFEFSLRIATCISRAGASAKGKRSSVTPGALSLLFTSRDSSDYAAAGIRHIAVVAVAAGDVNFALSDRALSVCLAYLRSLIVWKQGNRINPVTAVYGFQFLIAELIG